MGRFRDQGSEQFVSDVDPISTQSHFFYIDKK